MGRMMLKRVSRHESDPTPTSCTTTGFGFRLVVLYSSSSGVAAHCVQRGQVSAGFVQFLYRTCFIAPPHLTKFAVIWTTHIWLQSWLALQPSMHIFSIVGSPAGAGGRGRRRAAGAAAGAGGRTGER